jgi:hypothetical protein
VSATGDIRRRRDELIGRAAVCWLNGNSHDTAPHHLSDALRNQLDIHHDDVQVLKHFPEQFLVIFNNPRDRQRVVEVGVLPDNGRRFQFDAWSERRYANNIKWEFRVKVRIEGIPVHCWAEEVAAMALGKSCAVHYLEETTRRRQRTRSFDLWAWCFDPCDIPTEVLLTVTEPDRGHPHQDEPLDLKRGQVYVLRNHLEVVEDLTFLQEPGRLGGPLNRKARRVFDWDYGMPDTKGERLHGRRGQDRGRDIRPRRDDDDYDDRRARGNRRHRSISVWARNSRCRGGAEDCISSNRWRGRRESPPHRSRPAGAPTQVWVAKEQKQEKMVKEQEKLVKEQKLEKKIKKVSFADPIATELRAPKVTIPDDSIMFIKGTPSMTTLLLETESLETASLVGSTRAVVSVPLPHVTIPESVAADTALKQLEQHIVPGGVCPVDNTPTAEPGKAMEEPRGEQLGASKEKRLEQLLDHLNEFLVSPPTTIATAHPESTIATAHPESEVENQHNVGVMCDQALQEVVQNSTVVLGPASNTDTHQPPSKAMPSFPTANQTEDNIADIQPPSIDTFIESISRPLAQPIIEMNNMILPNPQATPQSFPSKRKSTRLARKVANNVGKDAIQIARELLVKKLGDLSGEEKEPVSDEFEFYAQHFARPMEKNTIEAIQGLIEHANGCQKTGLNLTGATGAPMLLA